MSDPQLARRVEGYEALIGLLMAYLKTRQNPDQESLLALVHEQLKTLLSQDPYDPYLDPFERLESMLRAQLGYPIHAADLPKAQWTGFPHPSLAVMHQWQQTQRQKKPE